MKFKEWLNEGIILYHGTQKDFPNLKPINGIIWLTPDENAAKTYAQKPYLSGEGKLWTIELSDKADIVDLSNLADPRIKEFKNKLNEFRKLTIGIEIPDERWAAWADFGMIEGTKWAIPFFKNKKVDGLIVKDKNNTLDHKSVALFNPKVIIKAIPKIIKGNNV